MTNPTEAALIRRIDRKRRVLADADERLTRASDRLSRARRTWQELCRDNHVYDISLFRVAAENFILANEAHQSATEIAEIANEHMFNAEAETE